MSKTNSDIAHYWANQIGESAKTSNGNFSFEGRKLYSYSTVIGLHFGDTVLLTNHSYSITTSSHLSDARQASNHLRQFTLECEVDSLKYANSLKECSQAIALDAITEFQFNTKKALRARSNKDYYITTALHYCNRLAKLMNEANVLENVDTSVINTAELMKSIAFNSTKLDSYINVNVKESLQREAKKRKQAKEELRLANQDKLNAWLNGESLQMSNQYLRSFDIHLRIKDSKVQTSQGAEVPLDEARTVASYLLSGKDTSNLIGEKIGYYTVRSITDKFINIGCHKIPLSEVKRLFS